MASRNLPGLARRINLWSLDRLQPYRQTSDPLRPRAPTHVRMMADSILAYGFNSPLLLDGGTALVAGATRLEAAYLIEAENPGAMSEGVPVVQLAHLTPAMRRAYRLADTQLAALPPWDEEALARELEELAVEAEVDMSTMGFTEEELAALGIFTGSPRG